jgi:hypothetical protein
VMVCPRCNGLKAITILFLRLNFGTVYCVLRMHMVAHIVQPHGKSPWKRVHVRWPREMPHTRCSNALRSLSCASPSRQDAVGLSSSGVGWESTGVAFL